MAVLVDSVVVVVAAAVGSIDVAERLLLLHGRYHSERSCLHRHRIHRTCKCDRTVVSVARRIVTGRLPTRPRIAPMLSCTRLWRRFVLLTDRDGIARPVSYTPT